MLKIEITKKTGRCVLCDGLIKANEKIMVRPKEDLGAAQEFFPNGQWMHTDCYTLTIQSARLPRR